MPRTAQDFATAAKINRFEKFERFGISRVPMRGAIKSHAGERLPEPLANVLGLRDQAEPLEKMIEVVAALKAGGQAASTATGRSTKRA